MSARRIITGVTHEAAAGTAEEERQESRLLAAREQHAIDRGLREQKDRQLAETAAQIPQRLVSRGVVGFDGEGKVRQSFSCACGKHDHGHGDEHNPFAGIIEPTVLEFIDPTEKARELAERVNRARTPKTPPAVPGTHRRSGRPNPERRPR